MEKPRVMEIKVRIDCHGCIQKIKKALHGINGINDIYIDVPQQKLTIIGCADPEKIIKAIKKTRKLAIISSETQPSPPTEPPLQGSTPLSDPSNLPPTETVTTPEPPKEPETPPPEPQPEPAPPSRQPSQKSPQVSGSKQTEEVHIIHHYPSDIGHRYIDEQVYKHEPQSVHMNHNYNTYKPTPYITNYKYIHSPPQYTHYIRPEQPQQFTHYNTPESPQPQQTHSTRQKPPQQHYTHYNRQEPPPQQTHYYARPEPQQHYTHYYRPELRYTQYNVNRPEPYRQAELPPQYMNYSEEYGSSGNGNGNNITSIFSDENPNACTIV